MINKKKTIFVWLALLLVTPISFASQPEIITYKANDFPT